MGILRELRPQGILTLLCALLITASSVTYGQDSPQMVEQKIKAGLVYNFLKYTVWPPAAGLEESGRLEVCLFGGDAFNDYLSPMEGRTAQKFVISIAEINEIREVENCNLIFISRSNADSIPELLDSTSGKSVLTISDSPQFVSEGGMVELTKKNEFIKIHINRLAVSKAGLTIQNRLMKLAEIQDR